MLKTQPSQFRLRDVAEIAVGAGAMAFPVAVTEEVWNLARASRRGGAISSPEC